MKFKTFEEFYSYYLLEHSDPRTRRWHLAGYVVFLGLVLTSLVTWSWWLLPVAIVMGYLPAWISHQIFEKNKPATFGNPLWSLIAGSKMNRSFLTGKLDLKRKW